MPQLQTPKPQPPNFYPFCLPPALALSLLSLHVAFRKHGRVRRLHLENTRMRMITISPVFIFVYLKNIILNCTFFFLTGNWEYSYHPLLINRDTAQLIPLPLSLLIYLVKYKSALWVF